MMHSLKELSDYIVRASNGDIGRIEAFYFDDDRWVVRYFIVSGGDWLDGRQLLLSPSSLGVPDRMNRVIPAHLTREAVKDSPVIAAGQPLSRQQEIALHNYYDWPFYWVTTVSGMGPGNPLASYPLIDLDAQIEENAAGPQDQNTHLRSTRSVFGYGIQARDGDIGNLEDFLVEENDWRILYLVVNTGGWLSNRKVLISPSWVEAVQWDAARVIVDLKRGTIASSPEYDPSATLDRGYESKLFDHYGRQKYWSIDGIDRKEDDQ